MDFVNHTPFPAQAFEGLDPDGQAFHVVVLRQTLSFASGVLEYADVQSPLCESDEYFGDANVSSVRQESDLCHYKPRCDVIVNAIAHAPQDRPRRGFEVRLRVRARGASPGQTLIDKTLTVNGERYFMKRRWPIRVVLGLIRCCSLGLLRPNPWKLGGANVVKTLPLRHEYAYGGECRINAGDPAAKKVRPKQRLSPEQISVHPDQHAEPPLLPVLHAVFPQNPVGKGFAQLDYLKVTNGKRFATPQIEWPDAPISAAILWRALKGKNDRRAHRALQPAGFGCRSKVNPDRCALCGTVDQAFVDGDGVLPKDFDFAYWNAAPPDQQCAFLGAEETIELVNLCAPDTPGAIVDANKNTFLCLTLPPHECFALCRQHDGQIASEALTIDTVIVEPENRTLTLVWRALLPKDSGAPLRACEARMRTHDERARMQSATDAVCKTGDRDRLAEPLAASAVTL